MEDKIDVLDETGSPCLIHQDFRWPNIKVQDESVSGIFDWERSISGHHEYDLAKAEESLLQFRSKRIREKYRASFLEGYREFMDLEDGWEKRRSFYRSLRPVEALWTFDGWTKRFSEEKKDAMAEHHREDLKKRMESYRKKYS